MKKRGPTAVSRSLGGNIAVFVVLAIFAAFMLLPFVYAVLQSFKPMEEIFAFPPRFFVVNPTLDSYYSLGRLTNSLWIPFSRYIFNSVFVTVVGMVVTVVISSLAAFPFAKFTFPGSKFMFSLVVTALLFTGPVTAIPQYIIMAKAGMINTYYAVIGPAVAGPMGVFLLKNFMSQISDSIIEAGQLDGASMVRIYWTIVLPNVKPAMLTLIILCFQSMWNITGASFIYEEKLKLLPTILSQISSSGMAYAGVAAAASVIMMLPPVTVFVILQSRVVETMAFAGIKE